MEQQDVILDQPFSKHGQSDWLKSLKRLARAQALAWQATPIRDRQHWIALAEAEEQRLMDDAVRQERILIHEQR